MFCAGCGTQIQSGLSYCNRCGRRVADESRFGKAWAQMVIAGLTAAVGFVAYIFVLLALSWSGVSPDVFKMVTLFYFGALFGLCFLFLRHGSPFQTQSASLTAERHSADDPAYLRPVTTAQLREGFDEPASITDHTTRTLDDVPIRRA